MNETLTALTAADWFAIGLTLLFLAHAIHLLWSDHRNHKRWRDAMRKHDKTHKPKD